MSAPKKAVPREKTVQFDPQWYRLEQVHFINGALHAKGELQQLPVGVEAGEHLTPVDEDGKDQEKKGNAKSNYDESFLARSIPDITEDLAASTDEELVAHLKFEKSAKGKQRAGLISAIEAEQASRAAQ